MLRTVADQPTFWKRFLPKELRRLSMELARVDALVGGSGVLRPVRAVL